MRALTTSSVALREDEDSGVPKRTPLILLWALLTLFWAIFTPPQWTVPARILLLQPVWFWRMFKKDGTWTQDLLLFLVLHWAFTLWTGAWSLPTLASLRHLAGGDRALRLYIEVFSLIGGCGLLAGLIVYRGHQLKQASKEEQHPQREKRIDEALLPPLLLPSRTTHARTFPRKNAFSYSYLLVGIPVGTTGRLYNTLSVDTARRGWFHVDCSDYLSRGRGHLGLAGKLKAYLHSQGVTERDYAFAYFVTAPQFGGYSFNPVSFWYLYDSNTKLKYMILEVNNTFGERRLYLLKPAQGEDGSVDDTIDDSEAGPVGHPKATVFRENWDKDFHVSPFNSRKGSYSLRAIDPLSAYQETGQVKIDNTIVLRSSKDYPKIVARVFTDSKPSDPEKITAFQLAGFIAGWWWVGFVTFPRIVYQAGKLFFNRKLHVWYKPEVAASSLGRSYTDDEVVLEAFFRAFITKVVEDAAKALRVVYQPIHSEEGEVVLYSPGFTYEEDHKRTLTIKVLTPAFYSRFVHYAHAKEAFDRECLATDENNRTVIVEPASLLPVLLDAMRASTEIYKMNQGLFDKLRWHATESLRSPPATQAYPGKPATPEYQIKDIRSFTTSELDSFVQRTCKDGNIYRRTVTKLFLAKRLGLGFPIVVSALDFMLRGFLLVAAMVYANNSDVFDILRPRPHTESDLTAVVTLLALANAVHLWNFAKA